MFRPSNAIDTVWLCREAVDFRKGINGLSVLVEGQLCKDPFSERLFVFANRKRDSIKILYWERSGFCLWQKRLERETFKWPTHLDGDVMVLDGQQLNWLLDGFNLAAMRPHRSLMYKTVL
ncbi:MAG: IS66 family insertion sequence element accessory protein TnpB [Pseudomonadota bacterium]